CGCSASMERGRRHSERLEVWIASGLSPVNARRPSTPDTAGPDHSAPNAGRPLPGAHAVEPTALDTHACAWRRCPPCWPVARGAPLEPCRPVPATDRAAPAAFAG